MKNGGLEHVITEHNKFLNRYFKSIEPQDEGSCVKGLEELKWDRNKSLDDHFRSLELDEECSLIKGMEDLKMDKGDVQDYIDNKYLSMNGTLYAMKDVLGSLPPVIGVTKVDLLGLYKFVDSLGGYMDITLNNKWNKVAHLLGLAQEDQEAVKECYKEYIGMVKIYYEEAQRSKQGRPGEDVVGNSSGTAWIKEPQVFAKMSVEIEDTLDGTPRKKSRIARDDVNKESNKEATNEEREASTSSSDDFIIIT
ncbi:ARID DNA-binding domain-containing protein [Tanacetum coccineum]